MNLTRVHSFQEEKEGKDVRRSYTLRDIYERLREIEFDKVAPSST